MPKDMQVRKRSRCVIVCLSAMRHYSMGGVEDQRNSGYALSMGADPLIEVRGVTRLFHLGTESIHAVRDVDLEIGESELVLIEGKSGSGKTTLLNLMGGLDRPTRGRIRYRGRDLGEFSERETISWRRKTVGFMFQAFALLPGLTAIENVDISARLSGLPPRKAREAAADQLELVGLAKRANHRISELSGGEQQRVALARGLVGGPEVVFADEPTGELDHATGRRVLDILRRLVEDGVVTVCLTSHDRAVKGYADRVYTLADGSLMPESKN